MEFKTSDGVIHFTPDRVIVAGWTGRDEAAVQHHIDELAEIGVPAPSTTPLYYRVSKELAVQTDLLEVVGDHTSGEAEPVLFMTGGKIWLTVGSDQTDRALEAHSVVLSKQCCAKPLAGEAWALSDIADLDALELRSWIDGDTPYQDGALAAIKPLAELMAGGGFGEGDMMYCGTLTAIGGVRPGPRFRAELRDPATGAAISIEYDTNALPLIS